MFHSYDIDPYLCKTPSPVYPVMMDEYMVLQEGIPERKNKDYHH